ncbi:helix-turn-helix domain-containing protein [Bacillus atrophaeus]|nr:helix-turn-helix transcriptional regulator [Bacillus atrophaeus]MCY8949989.1 helix-turn-helix domain-containing protein [Bacillus atrophaeus]
MNTLTLGKRLTQLRKTKKPSLKQSDVAMHIGVARATYGAYEQDKREPDNETLIKLANFYEVSIDYLLGFEHNSMVREDKDLYNITDDPDLQIAFKDASDFSEEARRQTIDFINYLKDKERAKGRKSPNTND